MFASIGRVTTQRPRLILLITALALVVAAVFGIHAPSRLLGGGYTSPNSPSQIAQNRLQAYFGGAPDLVFLVEARAGTVDSPAVVAAGESLARALAQQPGVTSVDSYWATRAPALRSRKGNEALVLANLAGSDSQVKDREKVIVAELSVPASTPGAVTIKAGGPGGTQTAINAQIGKDLALAEGLAIPLTAILLIIAFRSVVAALLPVALGVMSIFITLFVLWALSGVTDVSVYAINLTTAMGLGLGIDYALLVVNRYREELAAGRDPNDAVLVTVASAGRTVAFSAATVAAALAALLVFPVYFLRSFAYAGISTVVLSTVAALFVLPSLLALLGPRVNAWPVPWARRRPGRSESPFWRGVATRVMRRPILSGLAVIVLLLVAGAPFLNVRFGLPDDRVLPTTAAARQVGDALRADFGSNAADTLDVVTSTPLGLAAAGAYSARLSSLVGVVEVLGPDGTFVGGHQVAPASAASQHYQSAEGSWFSAVIRPDAQSAAASTLVAAARAVPADGATTAVGGVAAELVDQRHDLGSRLPIALALIAATTFIVLFLFTGSVVLPLKALVLNALNLSAVFGAIVWIFQEGHLHGLLGFTPTPTSMTMPLLLFCIAFGLSMDYEVFLLSRIKELRDAGASNVDAVAGGLARTGRIVTTAAALLSVTFLAFGLARVSFLQMFGIGTAIAIVVDATLVRGVLVPAFMRVAGDINWWAPGVLRRVYGRFGLREAPVDLPGGVVGASQ
jgi:RND superfamily putative drug exporter